MANVLVCGFALFLVLVFAFNLTPYGLFQLFQEEQITILINCCYLIFSLALGLDGLLADLPCVRDTGLHIIISGIS